MSRVCVRVISAVFLLLLMMKAGARPCFAMDVRGKGAGESGWEEADGGEAGDPGGGASRGDPGHLAR